MDYKDAYDTRLDILQKGHAAARNPWMRDLYQRGIDLLNDAMATYLELGAAASREEAGHERCAEIGRSHSKARLDQLVREADEQKRRHRRGIPAEDAALTRSRDATLLAAMRLEGIKQETQELMDGIRDRRMDEVARLDRKFREDILIGDTSKRTNAALRSVAMFGVGLIPGAGTFADGIGRLKALDDFELSKDRVANERVRELERFYKALSDFCADAKTLIARLDVDTEIWEEC